MVFELKLTSAQTDIKATHMHVIMKHYLITVLCYLYFLGLANQNKHIARLLQFVECPNTSTISPNDYASLHIEIYNGAQKRQVAV